MRRAVATGSVIAVAVLAGTLTGCGASSSTAPTSSPTTGSGTGSPSAGGSQRPESWVRGTRLTVTNGTDRTLQDGESRWQLSALAPGASAVASEDWGYVTTRAGLNVQIQPGSAFYLQAENPVAGYPSLSWCVLPAEAGGCSSDDTFVNLDEGKSQAVTVTTDTGATMATLTVTRNADDADNKNWTVTVNSVA